MEFYPPPFLLVRSSRESSHYCRGRLRSVLGCSWAGTQAQSPTTVLVGADRRIASQSLNGDWHYIVDPYDGGLYNFHRELRKDGFFLNGAPETGSKGLVEYDFSKSPTLSSSGRLEYAA
jgi:hypothetical protein